ncbi:MAG: HepT-like ribonuclease domain-containing protein, partial [Candidatus Methylomirabilales bacterium]
AREFQKQHDGVPWKKMISMRHRLVHSYDEIKLDFCRF